MASARILYWNLENFTSEKTAPVPRVGNKRSRFDREYGMQGPGPDRERMILNTFRNNRINGVRLRLDFIVIVEVYGRVGVPVEGQLIGGNGRAGCLTLLNSIRNTMGGNWGMVPPVVTGGGGRREAVAVYYRTDKWYFLGPETWPANYPFDLRAGLPNRTIPLGYPYRPNQQERLSAGQFDFNPWTPGLVPAFNALATVDFPGAGNRKPWLTAFGSIANQNLMVRLMAMHTTPNQLVGAALADQGTANIADIYTMTAEPVAAAQQIDVIVGDFNVDNMTQGNFQAGGPFGRLVGQGVNPVNPAYVPLLQPPNGLNAQYNTYYHTHGRGTAYAKILDDDDNPAGFYPGYRYTDLSIDNALVRHQGLVAPNSRMTILNRTVPTPYTDPQVVPNPDFGSFANTDWMDESVANIIAMAPDPNWDLNERFNEWDNYGTIVSTSDHFPLLFEI